MDDYIKRKQKNGIQPSNIRPSGNDVKSQS